MKWILRFVPITLLSFAPIGTSELYELYQGGTPWFPLAMALLSLGIVMVVFIGNKYYSLLSHIVLWAAGTVAVILLFQEQNYNNIVIVGIIASSLGLLILAIMSYKFSPTVRR